MPRKRKKHLNNEGNNDMVSINSLNNEGNNDMVIINSLNNEANNDMARIKSLLTQNKLDEISTLKNQLGQPLLHTFLDHDNPEISSALFAELNKCSPIAAEKLLSVTDTQGNTLLHYVALDRKSNGSFGQLFLLARAGFTQ